MSTQELVTLIVAEQEESTNQFVDIIQQKIEDAIEVKRIELASQMFAEASKKCPECGKADCECDDEEDEEDDEEAEQMDEAKKPKFKVGDNVHAGMGTKGGVGFSGKVVKVVDDMVHIHVDDPTTKFGPRIIKQHIGKVTKDMVEEVEQIAEKAKWRSSSAAKPDPDHDWDRSSKSTGGMRASSDTRGNTGGEYDHSSLENRRKAQVNKKTGKTTVASNTSLKNRIKTNIADLKNQRTYGANLPEEVEQIDEISNQTKRAYMGSAVADLVSRSLEHGTMTGSYGNKYTVSDLAKRQGRKIKNRQMGIARVSDALVKKEEAEQIAEALVIHKDKREPGTTSDLRGTHNGVTVKAVYTDKEEAQAHVNAINKGRPSGGVMYKVSPAESTNEEAPPGAKYERMIKDIKKSYSKDGLTNKEKAISYATAWKAKNREVNEAAMTDAQQMSALGMKGAERAKMMMAVSAYRRHGDINKLSAAHRTLVASYTEKTGGLSAVNRSAATQALKKERMQEE